MIKALLKNQALIDDIKSAKSNPTIFHLWWLGQSGFLLKWMDYHILIDPYLSDSLTVKYADTDKPHVRMTELVVNPGRLDFIDLVSSSHNHTDHLDGDTLAPLISANPGMRMIAPKANKEFITGRLGKEHELTTYLNDGQSYCHDGWLNIHGIPAAHNELSRDENGHCLYMGYVFQFGSFTVYHSGDTLWHDEIIKALKPFEIDLAILPINGNMPERRVAGNLNAREAVSLAKDVRARLLVPCHYHMFRFNTVDTDEFIEIAKREDQNYKVLQCGERCSIGTEDEVES